MGHGHDIPDPHCFLCAVSTAGEIVYIVEDEALVEQRVVSNNKEDKKDDKA